MVHVMVLDLSQSDVQQLKQLVKKHENWRVRERAQTVLLLGEGMTCAQVGARQELTARTIGNTRRKWIETGVDSLADRPRSGARAKLSSAGIAQLVQWARQEPLTMVALQARHEAAGGTPVHLNTLTTALKRAGFVWKRTRHSLKKSATRSPSSSPGKK
jgi:transposase